MEKYPRIAANIMLIGMVILVNVEIIFRNIFGFSLQLADEVASYLLVGLTFLGLADVYMSGKLMRIELIYARLRGPILSATDMLMHSTILSATSILLWYSFQFTLSSFKRGAHAGTWLNTPLWIPQILIPIGLMFLTMAVAKFLCQNLSKRA